MVLKAFTKNYADNSDEGGFQFTFFCDICQDGYKSQFIASKTHQKAKLFRGLSRAASVGASVMGRYGTGYAVGTGADVISERFQGMTPEWHKEHDEAFDTASNEATGHFHRCPRCHLWVCENDWNEQDGLCVTDAPRANVEITAARAGKMVQDIQTKAQSTEVFTGEIESKQTICPQCGKPAGQGKFCNNCGASLDLIVCPKCGAKSPASTRFCGECGNKFA